MGRREYRSLGSDATRVLPQIFDLPGATALGGLNQLAGFIRKLGVDEKLRQRFHLVKERWAIWRLDRVLRILLDAWFAGIERLYHYEDLETDPMLCALHGVDRLPDLTTVYKDLRRFEAAEVLRSLMELLREVVVKALAALSEIVLEFDSTVGTLYGRQEGAEVGPNPHKPGRPSYHPLLARERNSDLIVHHVLRPGNAGTATGIKSFLHQTLDIVTEGKPARKILARLDSGFEDEQVFAVFEKRRVGYVVKMRATPEVALWAATQPRHEWKWIQKGDDGEVQVSSFLWERQAWSKARRVVVLRKREMETLQGHLFDMQGWGYSLFVTDRDWDPEDVARFYDKRADVERTICEAKNDMSIDHVPTESFAANAADLALKVLARNLLVLYRDRELGLKKRFRVMTLRRRFLLVPGRIVRHGGRLLLRLSCHSPLRFTPQSAILRC